MFHHMYPLELYRKDEFYPLELEVFPMHYLEIKQFRFLKGQTTCDFLPRMIGLH